MSLNLKNAKKGMDRPLPPVGNHIARCYQIVDLGTQDSPRYGNSSHKIRISWELCEEMADFGKGKKEPFSVTSTVNFFFGRNSNFTKILEGWKGGTFSDKDLNEFQLKDLLGKACMVNVVHVTSGEKDYANVASVSPVPQKWKDRVPPLVNHALFYEIEMGPDCREYVLLPDFLQKIIAQCHEWRGRAVTETDPFEGDDDTESKQPSLGSVFADEQSAKEAIEPSKGFEDDSDIPF